MGAFESLISIAVILWLTRGLIHWTERRSQRGYSSHGNTQWREMYHAYLQSPEWQHQKYRVSLRSGGWCENCHQRPATQTHHLTYRNLGRENLWELMDLCGMCHRWVHGR